MDILNEAVAVGAIHNGSHLRVDHQWRHEGDAQDSPGCFALGMQDIQSDELRGPGACTSVRDSTTMRTVRIYKGSYTEQLPKLCPVITTSLSPWLRREIMYTRGRHSVRLYPPLSSLGHARLQILPPVFHVEGAADRKRVDAAIDLKLELSN